MSLPVCPVDWPAWLPGCLWSGKQDEEQLKLNDFSCPSCLGRPTFAAKLLSEARGGEETPLGLEINGQAESFAQFDHRGHSARRAPATRTSPICRLSSSSLLSSVAAATTTTASPCLSGRLVAKAPNGRHFRPRPQRQEEINGRRRGPQFRLRLKRRLDARRTSKLRPLIGLLESPFNWTARQFQLGRPNWSAHSTTATRRSKFAWLHLSRLVALKVKGPVVLCGRKTISLFACLFCRQFHIQTEPQQVRPVHDN